MKIKHLFYGLIIALGLFFIVTSVIAYFAVSPVLTKLFSISDKIEQNQALTDSIFIYSNLEGEKIIYNINNEEKIIHFWDIENSMCIKEIPRLNNYFKQSINKKKLLILSVNNKETIRQITSYYQINFPIYLIDTISLSLKHKFLAFPYTITIINGKLDETYLGDIRLDY